MRILFVRVGLARPSATNRTVAALAESLAELGHHVTILYLDDGPRPNVGAVTLVPLRFPLPVNFEFVRQAYFMLAAACWMLLNRGNWDQTISVDTPTGVEALAILGRKTSSPASRATAWVLDLSSTQAVRLAEGRLLRAAHRLRAQVKFSLLRRADRVVTIGTCMRQVLVENGVPESIVTVIRVGHTLPAEPGQAPSRTPSPSNGIRIRYFGTRSTRHPLSTLREALESPAWPAGVRVEVPDGPLQDDSWPIASDRLQVADHIPDPDFWNIARAADVHLASLSAAALGTCVPSKVYAAFAAGRPCLFIGPEECQAAMDLRDADAGWVVREGDVDALMAVLREVASDPNAVARKAVNASSASKRWSIPSLAQVWSSSICKR